MDKEVNELLNHIEHERLQKFVSQYADQHTTFKRDILEYFNPQKPGKSISEYRKIASGFFDFELPGRYRRNYDYYAAASDAEKELKAELFNWVGKEVKEKIYYDYGFDDIHLLLIPYTQAAGLINDALEIAEERIREAETEYRLERSVNDKIHLLQENNLTKEVAGTINQYIDLVSIRKMKISGMLEQKRYPEAIILVKEGIKVAEKKDHPGTVSDWKDQLLEIYIMMDDHGNIVKYAEDLFYNGQDALKYYHILKKETDKEKWPAWLETLICRRGNSCLFGYPDKILAQIFIEEQYWNRLLQLVENSDLSGLQTYEQHLKPRYPEELCNLFVQRVIKYADRNMGRHHYQKVAEILKKIRKYPGGNNAVDKLLAEFKLKYKARRAMMEELEGI